MKENPYTAAIRAEMMRTYAVSKLTASVVGTLIARERVPEELLTEDFGGLWNDVKDAIVTALADVDAEELNPIFEADIQRVMAADLARQEALKNEKPKGES